MKEKLDYARPDALRPRSSKLALSSMLISVLGCPCFSGWIFDQIGHALHWNSLTPYAVFGTIILALLLAIAALIEIKSSSGEIDGIEHAYFALTFCVLWIVVWFLGWLVFRDILSFQRD